MKNKMNEQQKIYSGKTKDIYKQPNGNLLIIFKDDVTGENGVVDPGSNSVLGQIKGKGRMSLELTNYFFKLFEQEKIPTHMISVDIEHSAMEAKHAELPGKVGALEFVCRLKAYGSFMKRYSKYAGEKLQPLDYLVEITLKDDERGDPLINDDAIVALNLLTRTQLENAKDFTRRIAAIVEKEFQKKDLSLIDMKVEFGLVDSRIILIDEVSADCMRVMDNNNTLSHEEIYNRIIK